jgi:hypothetical protein
MELSFDKNSNLSYIINERQTRNENNHIEHREEIDPLEMLTVVVKVI